MKIHFKAAWAPALAGQTAQRRRILQGVCADKKFLSQTSYLSLRRSIAAACVKLTASRPRPYVFDDLQGF